MMKKRVLSIFLSILTILLVIPGIHFSAEAATDYSAELRKKGFPESYVSSLNKLKQAHPNWNFEVLKVGETFFLFCFTGKKIPFSATYSELFGK